MIRKAFFKDKNSITFLFDEVKRSLFKHDIDQWDDLYPNIEDITNDIINETGYVYCNSEQIIGYICLNTAFSEEYNTINWINRNSNFLIVHRIAVLPQFQNKGIGRSLIYFSEQFALQNKIKSIRLDAFDKNQISLNFYKKLNYTEVGKVQFRKGQFTVFEKILE
jgi:GNAT superfamily N-acetyltransferase